MGKNHGVVPHISWGSLPEDQQARWTVLGCDLVVLQHVDAEAGDAVASDESTADASSPPPPSVVAAAANRTGPGGVPLWLVPPQAPPQKIPGRPPT